MIVVDNSHRAGSPGSPFGSAHSSKRPAEARTSAVGEWKYQGCFLPSEVFCHSYQPSAGMTQRCFFTAERKLGFVSRVSLRALIIRAPILGSLDHGGTRPQWASRSWRVISPLDLSMRSKITRISRVGAIFHEGVTSRASGT